MRNTNPGVDPMALPIDQRALLIVGLTAIVIVVVVVVRVLTGRPASNLSKRKPNDSEQNDVQKK